MRLLTVVVLALMFAAPVSSQVAESGTLQMHALNDGIADFLTTVGKLKSVTDLNDTPLKRNTLKFSDAEPSAAGAVFTGALLECFAGVAAANPSAAFGDVRQRMTQYLNAGRAQFPEQATFTEARNAILSAMRDASETDHAACRAGFAKRGLGAGAIGPARTSASLAGVSNGFHDFDQKVSIRDASLTNDGNPTLYAVVRNTGLVPLSNVNVTIEAAAGIFPDGATVRIPTLATDAEFVASVPVLVAPGAFSYRVRADILGAPAESGAVLDKNTTVKLAAGTFALESGRIDVPRGQTSVTLTVRRTGALDAPAQVEYETVGGTAYAGVNFNQAEGVLSWAAGESASKTITVTGLVPPESGIDGFFIVVIQNPSEGASLGSPARTDVYIQGQAGGGRGGSVSVWMLAFLLMLIPVALRRGRLTARA